MHSVYTIGVSLSEPHMNVYKHGSNVTDTYMYMYMVCRLHTVRSRQGLGVLN